jgi:hypothetical protein
MKNVVSDMTGSIHTLCLVYSSVKIYATRMGTLAWLIFLIPTKKGWNDVLSVVSEVRLHEITILKTDGTSINFLCIFVGSQAFL